MPNGDRRLKGLTRKDWHTPRLSASQSFNAEQVAIMRHVLESPVRGHDPRETAMRAREFGSLVRKVRRMHERIQLQKAAREGAKRAS
jgi:hypothetical protein